MSAVAGVRPLPPQVLSQNLQAVKELNDSAAAVAKNYFHGSSVKLPDPQKSNRFCIGCGDEKFSNEEWSKIVDRMRAAPPSVCNKGFCKDAFAFMLKHGIQADQRSKL